LLDYARRTRLIWLSVVADDPYADWQLIKIENHYESAKAIIVEYDSIVRQKLDSIAGLIIEPAQSVKPVTIELNFQNPYGYLAAALVSDYDQLACRLFSAMHVGVLDKKQGYRMLNKAGSGLRRLFSAAYEWKYTGVTRHDIINQKPNVANAIKIMGVCPEDIMNKTRRAENAPEIQQTGTNVSED